MNAWTWFDPTTEQTLALIAAAGVGYWCWVRLLRRVVG